MQEDEENGETLQQKLDDLQKAQNEMFASQDSETKKSPRFKILAGRSPRSSPIKDGKQLLVHGGIVKPFKPPAKTGPSGLSTSKEMVRNTPQEMLLHAHKAAHPTTGKNDIFHKKQTAGLHLNQSKQFLLPTNYHKDIFQPLSMKK